jgi:hypothetical protein
MWAGALGSPPMTNALWLPLVCGSGLVFLFCMWLGVKNEKSNCS